MYQKTGRVLYNKKKGSFLVLLHSFVPRLQRGEEGGEREGKKEEKEKGREGEGKMEERDEYGVCIENLRVHVSSAVAAAAAAVMAALHSSLLEYPRACPPRPRPRPSPRPPRSPLHP